MKKINFEFPNGLYLIEIKEKSLIQSCLRFCRDLGSLNKDNKKIVEGIIRVLKEH